jgi:nucleotide-binding universal stress UspA family protein
MKILLATDGSPESEAALTFSAQLARRDAISMTILAIVDSGFPIESAQVPDSSTQYPQAVSKVEGILARAIELVGVAGINTRVRFGDAFTQILHEASAGAYDLIVIGDSRPRNILRRFRRNSMAVRIAENAPCSVILVRGKVSPICRILLCDSGAGMSSLLSRLVLQLAELLEGDEEVCVLHVMSQISASPVVQNADLKAVATELIAEHAPEGEILEQDVKMLEKPGIHPTPKVRHGLVVDEILAEARSGDYDLVVVGAHPIGKRRFMLDNIAHQVIKEIARPILVVRAKGEK